MTNCLIPPLTYVALGFITVSTNSNCAPLHKSHQPLKVPLVDNTSVVLKGLWIVCVKLLQCVKTQDKWQSDHLFCLLLFSINALCYYCTGVLQTPRQGLPIKSLLWTELWSKMNLNTFLDFILCIRQIVNEVSKHCMAWNKWAIGVRALSAEKPPKQTERQIFATWTE